MRDLFLDILRIGRRSGTCTFDVLKEKLVSKGYVWSEIQEATIKWFADSFEAIGEQLYILKLDVERWLLDYETKKDSNTAKWLIFIVLACLGLKLIISPGAEPRSRIKGFEK